LLFFVWQAEAQNLDSLYTVYRASSGVARIVAANDFFEAAYELALGDTLFSVNNTDDREYVEASVLELMGAYYTFEEENYKNSNDFYKQAIAIYEKLGKFHSVNKLNGSIGNNYARMGDYENAVAYMMKNYEWETAAGDMEGLSSTFNNLGVVYSRWGRRDMAMQFFEKSVEAERPLNRPYQYASRLAQLAREYSYVDKEKALSLIKEALVHDEKIEQQRAKEERIAVHTLIKGEIYFTLDSLTQAERCFHQSLVFFENNARPLNVATTLLSLGRLQAKAERWREAVATLRRCEEIAETGGFLSIQRDACHALSDAYNRIEQGAMAYSYLRKYTVINDSIFRETTQQQINDFQVRYDVQQKELEITRQQAEIDRQTVIRNVSFAGLAVAFIVIGLLVYIVALRNRRNRDLVESNATKDKFFNIISHDLKNPAVAQRDGMQFLADNAEKWDANNISYYCRKQLKSANGMVELLKNLLNWAQLQTGRNTYRPAQFNLMEVIQSDMGVIKSMAEQKNITFVALTPQKAFITADENMLTAVVRNLLANAVKFTEEGGKVVLEIKEIKACGDKKDKEIKACGTYIVSVSDTGRGMSREQQQNLFRIDLEQSTRGTSGEQGTGLGLIVCKEFLKKHGTTLHVESEEGKGSRFWFEV